MKTVVTGGAGFIGCHLVRRLLDQGREVVVADDFSRGDARRLREFSVDLDPRPVDLRDYHQTHEVIAGAQSVFHLAARVGSVEFLHGTDRAELVALQTNLVIDANVFRACLEHNVPTVVYASSVSVYPIAPQQSMGAVFAEDDAASVDPEGGYGWAKLMGEIQLRWMTGIRSGIARLFSVYGEGEEPDETSHVVPAIIRKVILTPRGDFPVWGDGAQTRDFLHVADAVEALIRLESAAAFPPVVVNIGSGAAVSVREVVDKIVQISGKDVRPVFLGSGHVGPRSRTADITRMKTILHWQPRVNLDDGLRRTYTWIEERLVQPLQP
ncbi:MAG: NAD-dependent epimerase/dehydratase family protein [Armatimonadota bacterium]|nr:NAD-dependent epimerase/dehydratase family protein [Armatimonadota bacterium]